MKKQLFIVVVVMLLICSLAFAGGKKEAEITGPVPGSEGVPGTFPIVEDTIELTVFALQDINIEDMETNLFTKEYEEKTNIHINWEMVPKQGLQEKRNLILASGDYPDILFGTQLTLEEQMLYGSQGALIPLNDLIEEYGVEIKKLFNTIPWFKSSITAPDGNIYALPQIDECFHCYRAQKMWINKKWLDKLGLDIPTTTEEFRTVLRAFKEQDPNGNGKADEIPLTGAIKIWHSDVPDFLMCAFIYTDGDDNTFRVSINDGKVESIADKDAFRDGLRYINSLYEEGLIDPAAFTQNREQLTQLGENPEAQVIGAATSGWFGYFSSFEGDRHKDYVALPPLKGPKGVQLTGYFPFGSYPGEFSITKDNKYPEASIRWVDWFFSEEGSRRMGDGREGIEWEVPEEGVMGINGEQARFRRLVSFGEIQNVHWSSLGTQGKTTDYRLSEVRSDTPYEATGLETRLYDETQKYVGFEPKEIYPPLYMTTEMINEMAQLKGSLMEYIKSSMSRFIVGNLDIENDWDDYIKGLDGLGLTRYIEICQEAYDSSAYSK